jgi:hypothetical protein
MATVALTVPQMVDDSFIRWRSDCLEDCSMIDKITKVVPILCSLWR